MYILHTSMTMVAAVYVALQGDGLQQQLAAASATEADLRKQLESSVAEAASLQVGGEQLELLLLLLSAW